MNFGKPKWIGAWLVGFWLIGLSDGNTSAEETRWWPVQTLPKTVVRTPNQQEFPDPQLALQMMVQSVAGLAAKAVNEGRNDELVWVDNGNVDLEDWYARWLAAHPDITQAGTLKPWELVDRYAKRGVIKGYILYRLDRSRGELNDHRSNLDCSVNVATSLAGLLDSIMIAEELEVEAKAHGLTLLMDAREKTQAWCFATFRSQLNRHLLCTQDPSKPHVRDLAIAQKVFTTYGNSELTSSVMAWLAPLSPILGWNGGDEFDATDLSSRFGHIQTATDWCLNLPVLMAGSEKLTGAKAKDFDPNTIDWNDQRSAVSFVLTDGDNVQWFQGNFFRGTPSYWSNPARGSIPFGWSTCFAQLAQLCPSIIDYATSTRSTNDSFIEWGGGYYYPDHFGSARSNRWELLATQAKRTWTLMNQTGTRILGFNLSRVDSPDARKAYEVIASQTDGLLGLLAFQYSPYEGGAGRTFWVKDRNGVDVPVITARYSIWEHSNSRPRAGTPARVAHEIRETVERTSKTELPRYDWVIAHAWSFFKEAPGTNEDAEDMPQADAPENGGVRGFSPVVWCGARLPTSIRVASPEEMLWRLRRKRDPAQTKQFMSAFKP